MTPHAADSAVASTFSIVAADPAAGQVGVAVQSKYLAVGAVVPWARAGVGAVATQALGLARYGPELLARLEAGSHPRDAPLAALADDPLARQRQVGVVRADGQASTHTGDACLDWAGGRAGEGFAAQGNILTGPEVVDEMVRAYLAGPGGLAERLVASLEAGQAAGGDRRGQQSAAILVEQAGYRDLGSEGIDKIFDLRVDDHPQPIAELRRVLGLRLRQEVSGRAMRYYNARDFARAAEVMADGAGRFPDSPDILYNLACFESLAGRAADALTHLRQAVALDVSYRELAGRDTDFEPLRASAEFQALLSP